MANNTIDYRIKFAIESKEYQQTLRKANQEAKEFKRQQREAFKNSGANEGMNAIIASAKKFAPAISASAAALAVVNKAMRENQTYTDEWARITESARATYESFVDSLVNADFSGFFDNMANVVQTARDAADAIDNLDTTKIFNSKAMADLNLQAAQYRLTLRSKTATAEEKELARAGLIGVRDSQMAEAQRLSNANLQAFADTLVSNIVRKGGSLTRADILTTDEAGNYVVRQNSKYQKYLGYLENYYSELDRYNAFNTRFAKRTDYQGNAYRAAEGFGTISEAEFQDLKAFMEVSDEKLRQSFDYYIAGLSNIQRVIEMKTSDTRYISATTGGGKTSTTAAEGSIAALQNSIREAEGDLNSAADAFGRHAARRIISKLREDMAFLEMEGTALGEGLSIGMTGVGGLSYKMVGSHLAKTPIAGITAGEYKDTAKASETAAQGVSLLTDTISQLGILSNITAPEVQQFTRTLGSILSMIGSSIGGPWGIALQGIGGIVSSFSGGGVVGGTSYKGDRLLAAVNSGEMILNGYQQKQLLDIISSGGAGGVQNISAVVRGEDMYLALSNYKRRTRR
ncbi:MAG: hypothetical protein J6U45_07495 [Alistipes sp.]|nr:hypothetical protein [Alistipes sp.]